MSRYQRFEIARATRPEMLLHRPTGYEVASTVSMLFDHIAHERYDPDKADLSTLKVERIDGGIRASVYVESEFSIDRLTPTP